MSSKHLISLLERGTHFPFTSTPDPGTADGFARIGDLWDQVRTEFMAGWVERNPGTRPWAWWEFDAPELRHRIDGEHPFDKPGEARAEATGLGRGDMDRTSHGVPAVIFPDEFVCEYEGEADYLDRLDLLEDHERTALADAER